MTIHEFKKRSGENKAIILNATMEQAWWRLMNVMGNAENHKYNESQMVELYGIVNEFKDKIENYLK